MTQTSSMASPMTPAITPAIVSLKQASKAYQGQEVLSQVDLDLAPGEVLGLFGHNGAGKTTMMKLILGIMPPSQGKVSVFGVDPMSKQAWLGRRKIGYLPENVSFYDQLTGKQVLNYFARLKSVDKPSVLALLEQVGLTHAMNRAVKTYSKGMKQRLGLAQAFLGEPKLLLLDEPTVGLDPIATKEFYLSVDKLKSDGASIILCSHVLPGVEQHIDRALILGSGKALAMGTLAELRQQANLPVAIRTQGLNGSLQQNAALNGFMVGADLLHVSEAQKMAVMRQLMSLESLQDIQLEPADLGCLYQHFLSQAADKSGVKPHSAQERTQP